MKNMEQFLRNSVFYPCSGLDSTPVKLLVKQFQTFLYADYHISKKQFKQRVQKNWVPGYKCNSIDDVDAQSLFGCSFEQIKESHKDLIEHLPFDWRNPFIVLAKFQRLPNFTKKHGPDHFALMFVCCEAISTFEMVFSRLKITSGCVAYIRTGLGKGGNFEGFPDRFASSLKNNPGGLPKFLLYDKMGGDRTMADYLPLIKSYKITKTFARQWADSKEYIKFAEYEPKKHTKIA